MTHAELMVLAEGDEKLAGILKLVYHIGASDQRIADIGQIYEESEKATVAGYDLVRIKDK